MQQRDDHPDRAAPTLDEAMVRWLAGQPGGIRPEVITELARGADVIGLGFNNREGRETFAVVTEFTTALVARDVTTIAMLDSSRVVDAYDRYVGGDDVDVDDALSRAWGPWQTMEVRETLTRLRLLNRRRGDRPIRLIGLAAPGVLTSDYDRVIELLEPADPATAAEVRSRLDVIRVAHGSGEHVLRARGTHPGVPFVDLATEALTIASDLAPGRDRDEAVRLLEAIVGFHANAIGVGFDPAAAALAAAERLLRHRADTGDRVVLWEGSSHVAAHAAASIGAHLRAALGDRYVAVHVTFASGRIDGTTIPMPRATSIEAHMSAAGGARTVPLRVAATETGPAPYVDARSSTRIVSGVYDAAHDDDHYLELPSLRSSFDAVAYVPEITPMAPLGPGSHDAAAPAA